MAHRIKPPHNSITDGFPSDCTGCRLSAAIPQKPGTASNRFAGILRLPGSSSALHFSDFGGAHKGQEQLPRLPCERTLDHLRTCSRRIFCGFRLCESSERPAGPRNVDRSSCNSPFPLLGGFVSDNWRNHVIFVCCTRAGKSISFGGDVNQA